MSSIRVHFMETGSDRIPIADPPCRRVPSWATRSTNPADVTCSWCLRWLRKRRVDDHPAGSQLRVQRDDRTFSIYRVERRGHFIGRVALLTSRRWSATGPTADVLGEHFACRRDAVDALVRHDDELHQNHDADVRTTTEDVRP